MPSRRRTVTVASVGSQEHLCQLEQDELITRFIDAGPFILFRRALRRYFMLSRDHPNTSQCVRSQYEIRKEELRHLTKHYYIIHPFSTFALHWTYVMTVVLTIFLLIIPIEMGSPLSEKGDTRHITMPCQIIHVTHIMLRFAMGYYVKSSNRILLNPKEIAKYYLKTYFFIEAFSCVPLYAKIRRIFDKTDRRFVMYKMLSFLKVLLVPQWLDYVNTIQRAKKLNDYSVSMFKIIMIFIVSMLWTYSAIWNAGSSVRMESWTGFLVQLEQATEILTLSGIPGKKDATFVHILLVLIGCLFQMFLCIGISLVWTKYSSVFSRHERFLKGLDAFMKYNQLPENKRERIRTYINFKFQGKYYKEQSVNNILTEQLKQDVMESVANANMQNLELLFHLPKEILSEFCKYLQSETYLAGDIIAQAGTIGNSMCFIVAGTVGVVLPNGQNVAILKDGMNFGEVSLILRVAHIANVVAIRPCEILHLNRRYFLQTFANCSSTLDVLKRVAEGHLLEAHLKIPSATEQEILDSVVDYSDLAMAPYQSEIIEDKEAEALSGEDEGSKITMKQYSKELLEDFHSKVRFEYSDTKRGNK